MSNGKTGTIPNSAFTAIKVKSAGFFQIISYNRGRCFYTSEIKYERENGDMLHLIGYTFRGMSFSQLILWIFIYSFLGWIMECIVIRIQLGHWENRGFVRLPFCIIYGFGVYIAYHILAPFENNYLALYLSGSVAATIFEYLTAWIMLKMFGKIWWDYSHLKFNYKGILCLESSIGWGFLALFIIGIFDKFVQGLVVGTNEEIVNMVAACLLLAYLYDFACQFRKQLKLRNT